VTISLRSAEALFLVNGKEVGAVPLGQARPLKLAAQMWDRGDAVRIAEQNYGGQVSLLRACSLADFVLRRRPQARVHLVHTLSGDPLSEHEPNQGRADTAARGEGSPAGPPSSSQRCHGATVCPAAGESR